MRALAACLLILVAVAGGACSGGSGATADGAAEAAADAADLSGDPGTDPSDAPAEDGDLSTDGAETADAIPLHPYADLVDPRIGTGGRGWWAGNASIGASRPFGLVQAGPDGSFTGGTAFFNHCSGYHAGDDTIEAFSHTHLHGTGMVDLGFVGFMPVAGSMDASRLAEGGYSSPFDPATEDVHPGYYAVTLPGPQVRAEMAATDLAAYHRWTPVGDHPGRVTVIIDVSHTLLNGFALDGGVDVLPGTNEVRVWARSRGDFTVQFPGVSVFHAVRFRNAPVAWGTFDDGKVAPSVASGKGRRSGAWLEFDASGGATIEFQVGVSFVDLDGAVSNLAHDLQPWDFDAARAAAADDWEAQLSKVAFEGGTEAQRTIMATAVYHTLLTPNRFSDADGRYLGFDQKVHTASERTYTTFSLWDTYRTLHPLLILVQPQRQAELIRTLVLMAKQGGFVPKWVFASFETNVMIGSPGDIVVAESYLKGLRDFDVDAAYAAAKAIATAPTPTGSMFAGRDDVSDYVALGYVPAGKAGGSVSQTQEDAICDFALSKFAAALGKTEDAALFAAHAKNPWNLWNDDQKLFVGRNADGSWRTVADPTLFRAGADDLYTEGNALQYRWLVPHDPVTLRDRLGGAEAMAALLTGFLQGCADERAAMPAEDAENDLYWMTNPPMNYWQGNEPDIHAAYLFLYALRPDLAQKWVRWIQDTLYSTARSGIPGNDDCGTMSAWWVFAALGFYPLGGTDLYLVGAAPTFPHTVLDLGGGKTLVVDAPGAGQDRPYVKSVTLNGVALDQPSFRHATIAAGGTLAFEVSATPTDWGKAGPEAP